METELATAESLACLNLVVLGRLDCAVGIMLVRRNRQRCRLPVLVWHWHSVSFGNLRMSRLRNPAGSIL